MPLHRPTTLVTYDGNRFVYCYICRRQLCEPTAELALIRAAFRQHRDESAEQPRYYDRWLP